MCTGLEVLMAAGTGLSVLGQINQGQQQADYYKEQAKQSEINATTQYADAMTQADKIRKAGRRQVGETKAQLAASGVKLGEGTPLELQDQITQQSEQDAFSTILTGQRAAQSGYTEASSMRTAASNVQGNTVLSTAGTVAQGWYLGKKG